MTAYLSASGVARLASWPATLAHELTHMFAALPWAKESAVIVDDRGPAHYVTWRDETPRWAIWIASLAPTLLGSLVGVVGLARLAMTPPSTLNEWALAAAIAGYWIIYVAPSGDDLDIPETAHDTTQ